MLTTIRKLKSAEVTSPCLKSECFISSSVNHYSRNTLFSIKKEHIMFYSTVTRVSQNQTWDTTSHKLASTMAFKLFQQDEWGVDRDPWGEPGAAAEHDDVQVHRILLGRDLSLAEVPVRSWSGWFWTKVSLSPFATLLWFPSTLYVL